jgi:fibronectin type 3 domain-containing protein
VQGFNTTFVIQDTQAVADGLTFTMQNQSPTALGGGGAGLGYANPSGNDGIPNSVCIKFDLYNNVGEGADSTGLFVDGDTPTKPIGYSAVESSVTMNASGIVLNSGDLMQVNLAYNGATLVETVTDEKTNAVFTHSYTLNIPAYIGNGYAYLGFTAASGDYAAIQTVQSWSYTVVAAAPNTPTNLTVTPASGTELNLSWTDPYSSVTNYNVLELINGSYHQIAQVAGSTTLYDVTGLSLGTTYYFEVEAVNTVGSSAASSAVSGTTPVPPLDISNLQYNSLTTTSINLTWTDNADNATGIDVVRQLESNNSQYLTTLANTATGYDDTNLLPGAEYDYEITAINLAGPAEGVDVIIETVPVAPTGVTATANASSITLNWAFYGHAVALWNVYRGTSNGDESAAPIATNVSTNSYTDANATPGVTYYYKITAVDTGGESAQSAEVSATVGSNTTAVALTGPANYLRLDTDGSLDVYSNTTGTGTPIQFSPSSVTVTGSSSPSSLLIDFSLGNCLPPSGISINGSTGGMAITFLGTIYNDSLSVAASTASFDQVPISYSNVSSITFNGGSGSDTLTQSAGSPPLTFQNSTPSDSLVVNGGTYTIAAPVVGAGIVPVTIGSVTIAAGAEVSLANAQAHTDRTLLQIDTLAIAGSTGHWQGTLNLGDNDLDVSGGNLASITNQLASGYAQGAWTGTGIVSSSAANDTTHLTALGVLLNNDGNGNALYGSTAVLGLFDGINPASSDVLVKYTYYGDANLDGKPDGSDFTRIDNGYLNHLTGWYNGDFNYSGAIDGSDYTLIDNGYSAQESSLSASRSALIAANAFELAGTDAHSKIINPPVISTGIFQQQNPIALNSSLDAATGIEALLLKKDRLDALD